MRGQSHEHYGGRAVHPQGGLAGLDRDRLAIALGLTVGPVYTAG